MKKSGTKRRSKPVVRETKASRLRAAAASQRTSAPERRAQPPDAYLCALPEEVLLALFVRLNGSTVARLGGTCAYLRRLAWDPTLWQSFCRDKGFSGSSTFKHWRHQYVDLSLGRVRNHVKKLVTTRGTDVAPKLALARANLRLALLLNDNIKGEVPIHVPVDDKGFTVHTLASCSRFTGPFPEALIKTITLVCKSQLYDATIAAPRKFVVATRHERWKHMRTSHDGSVALYKVVLDDPLYTATLYAGLWSSEVPAGFSGLPCRSGMVAFIAASVQHSTSLLALLAPLGLIKPPPCKAPFDDIDSEYGLHDYTASVEIRTTKHSRFSSTHKKLFCKLNDVESPFRFLMFGEDEYQRSTRIKGALELPFKTPHGVALVFDAVFVDFSVWTEHQALIWSFCEVLLPAPARAQGGVDIDVEGSSWELRYDVPDKGSFHFAYSYDEAHRETVIDACSFSLATCLVAAWFGRQYKK